MFYRSPDISESLRPPTQETTWAIVVRKSLCNADLPYYVFDYLNPDAVGRTALAAKVSSQKAFSTTPSCNRRQSGQHLPCHRSPGRSTRSHPWTSACDQNPGLRAARPELGPSFV